MITDLLGHLPKVNYSLAELRNFRNYVFMDADHNYGIKPIMPHSTF